MSNFYMDTTYDIYNEHVWQIDKIKLKHKYLMPKLI